MAMIGNTRKNTRNQKGFTLIEIMVAMVLVALLAMIFLPVFTMTIRQIYLAGDRNTTTFEDQGTAEVIIENPVVPDSGDMLIVFDGVTYTIPGESQTSGKLEYFQPSSDTSAWED